MSIILLLLQLRLAVPQQNDFRARSMEDSWGHQAMRLNRWSVMHRVWDGLYDLKNIGIQNVSKTTDNYGQDRVMSDEGQKLMDSYSDLVEVQKKVAASQTDVFDKQSQINALIAKSVEAQLKIAQADRAQQIDNMSAIYDSNNTANQAFRDNLMSTYDDVLGNRLEIESIKYQRDYDVLQNELNDLKVLQQVERLDAQNADFDSKRADFRYQLFQYYHDTVGPAQQKKLQDMETQIQEAANSRIQERDVAEKAMQQATVQQYEDIKALTAQSSQKSKTLYQRAMEIKTTIRNQLTAEFLTIMDNVMNTYEEDRMSYLDQFSILMERQKEQMREANRQRLLLIQKDKQEFMKDEELLRKLSPRDDSLVSLSSDTGDDEAQSAIAINIMGGLVTVLAAALI
eukprot:GHVH01006287.1.p1 GENE.GHVH01006287.1~~GHVH01006287.1.p1  ORF type:complete len:399 (+),score=70.10 GHVH01006287.1:146-1342(+)